MGGLCSIYRPDRNHAGMDAHDFQRTPSKLVNNPHHHTSQAPNTNTMASNVNDSANTYDLADALDGIVKSRRTSGLKKEPRIATVLDRADRQRVYKDKDDYSKQLEEIRSREAALSWDYICKRDAEEDEINANRILQAMRKHDDENIYAKAPKRRGYGGQEHPRFMGDHFLYNVDLIEKTMLFEVAKKMPKGAHLHIHFNANLLPNELIDMAKTMDRMFITSNIPLVTIGKDESEPGFYDNFDMSKIQFSILSVEKEKENLPRETWKSGECSLFDPKYPVDKRPPMNFKRFLAEFGNHYTKCTVDQWLEDKLVFHEEEAHGWLQTAEGAWDRFNTRTQMMKGLFNYKTAYETYTRKCLQEFLDDNIQYAEIRPNFMVNNQLWDDVGVNKIDNAGIMKIIKEQCEKFMGTYKDDPENKNRYFQGIKVIYCAPRSFEPSQVETCLNECLEFKTSTDPTRNFAKWIAGFDLVGEESKGRPLYDFREEFIDFKNKCRAKNVDIPFLLHCGETLDIGNDTDDNLRNALLLGAKRIGHGFALTRHPYVMEQMKKDNICLELCPISNEVLGLTSRANGHAMYGLLANNVHCTVNTDNGTLFKSKLSHDFYQVFAGKNDMTLYGWKQLAMWSIEHSCLEPEERQKVEKEWSRLWVEFCKWIVQEYSYLLDDEPDLKAKA